MTRWVTRTVSRAAGALRGTALLIGAAEALGVAEP